MIHTKFWRYLFLIAGLYTAGAVVPSIMDPAKGLLDFTGKAITDENTLYFFQSLWIIIFFFGIGYLMVALRPTQHIGIVILGFLGKASFGANLLYLHLQGRFSTMTLFAALMDLLFALFFGIFIVILFKSDWFNFDLVPP